MRVILGSLLFITVITGPWWVPLGIGAVMSARWNAWEVLVAGAFFDVLYASDGGFWGVPVLGTLTGCLFVFILMPLRERLLAE